jgi:hypothetical protein
MRAQVSKHRAQAQRGGNPSQLHDVQAFLAVKFRDKGHLDFQQQGGHDTSWIQVGGVWAEGWGLGAGGAGGAADSGDGRVAGLGPVGA